jgi:hypothetical protein
MSRENVEAVRVAIDEFDSGEMGPLFACVIDPHVEQRFTAVMSFPEGRCTRWHFYADHTEAPRFAGLGE